MKDRLRIAKELMESVKDENGNTYFHKDYIIKNILGIDDVDSIEDFENN